MMPCFEGLFQPDPLWERVVVTIIVGIVTFFTTLRHMKRNAEADGTEGRSSVKRLVEGGAE
jgi:hypothetical protein